MKCTCGKDIQYKGDPECVDCYLTRENAKYKHAPDIGEYICVAVILFAVAVIFLVLFLKFSF